jgi:hypothetical protein
LEEDARCELLRRVAADEQGGGTKLVGLHQAAAYEQGEGAVHEQLRQVAADKRVGGTTQGGLQRATADKQRVGACGRGSTMQPPTSKEQERRDKGSSKPPTTRGGGGTMQQRLHRAVAEHTSGEGATAESARGRLPRARN